MAESTPPRNESDDLLKRADALLSRLRAAEKPVTGEIPTLAETPKAAPAEDDIPTLTEVIPADRLPAVATRSSGEAAGGEVISRVQAQNLEHSLYQRLKRDRATAEGSGLGLSVVTETAAANGWTITSCAGRKTGASIRLELP